MLPKEWELCTLEELALVERGKFSARPRNDPKYYGGKTPFVQTGDVTSAGTYLLSYSQSLNEDGVKVSKVFPKNTILITIAANIGDTAITTFDVACPDSVVAIQPYNDKADVFWLKKTLETHKSELDSKATQNAQKNINLQVLKPLVIRTPPLAEQKKIAKILSTWDKAIAAVEKLITNSQQQKKALMQQLLTGKKRLPGFGGEWKISPLKKLMSISKGKQLNRNTLSERGKVPVINGGVTPSGYTDNSNCVGNTITISEGGNSCGYVSFQKDEFWCGGHCYAIKDLMLHVEYAYQLLKFYENKIMRLRVGSGLPNIQKRDLEALHVLHSGDMAEQKEIAQVLSAADNEIEILQGQLEHLKQEKKGLMQQLLTGKRRVKAA